MQWFLQSLNESNLRRYNYYIFWNDAQILITIGGKFFWNARIGKSIKFREIDKNHSKVNLEAMIEYFEWLLENLVLDFFLGVKC